MSDELIPGQMIQTQVRISFEAIISGTVTVFVFRLYAQYIKLSYNLVYLIIFLIIVKKN